MTSLTPTRPAASLTPAPASLSFAALEAAMLAAPYGDAFDALVVEWTARLLARVVTGDDGLDHYL